MTKTIVFEPDDNKPGEKWGEDEEEEERLGYPNIQRLMIHLSKLEEIKVSNELYREYFFFYRY